MNIKYNEINSNKIKKQIMITIWFSLIMVFISVKSIGQTIVYSSEATDLEILAAKEVRRYLYLRTGEFLNLKEIITVPPDGDLIIISDHSDLLIKNVTGLNAPTGGFFIKSEINQGRNILLISGDAAVSTLYGAYHFAEKLGCRFYLHGDVIPDKKINLNLTGYDEKGQPLTKNGRQWTTRGIQPFQNFPPGAVMWGRDDWKMYITQLPKMGMNFVGLHTYMYDPEDDHVGDYGPNLNIWLGHENDLNPDGTVKFAFDATFFHTQQGIIGWGKTNTSDLVGGASQLFSTDGYPSEIIGEEYHRNQKGYTESFNKAAKMFSEVFTLANELGIITATGVEMPIGKDGETGEDPIVNGIPEILQDRLRTKYDIDPFSKDATAELFKGMYKWLMNNDIPINYFWMWTTEIWMPWGGASKDSVRIATAKATIKTAVDVYNTMSQKPFDHFALGGWVTGAQVDPDVFGDVLPELSSAYAFMNPPYNMEGRQMKNEDWVNQIPAERVQWPFTWMEYDYALEQPSFHMNRVYEDAWDGYEQNSDGFLGEFWRTKMIAPMFAAFKDVTWDYSPTEKTITHDIPSNREGRNSKINEIHLDWAIHEFGPGPVAEHIAEFFAEFEKQNDKRFKNVMNFIEGADDIYSQGYIKGDDWGSDHIWGPWEEEKSWFKWIDDLDKMRSQIEGAGNLVRFDYWHNVLKAHKLMANFASELNQYEENTDNGKLSEAAKHRSKLTGLWEEIMSIQVQRIYDEVDLGVILNLDWRTWKNWVEGKYDKNFLKAGGFLPIDKDPSKEYTGGKFISCLPLLTQIKSDELVKIKVLIMGDVKKPELHYRTMGETSFTTTDLFHDARGVYRGVIPEQNDDFEWYVTAETSLGNVIFPATADADLTERMYQTVVVK